MYLNLTIKSSIKYSIKVEFEPFILFFSFVVRYSGSKLVRWSWCAICFLPSSVYFVRECLNVTEIRFGVYFYTKSNCVGATLCFLQNMRKD